MPPPPPLSPEQIYRAERARLDANRLAIARAKELRRGLDREGKELGRRFRDTPEQRDLAARLEQRRVESALSLNGLEAKGRLIERRLATAKAALSAWLAPRMRITDLDAEVPLLLFPMRLETRFIDGGASGKQLLVRVYPDDCSIDSFEPDFSEAEFSNLKRYWCSRWRAAHQVASAQSAWRELCAAHGAGRALYLVGKYRPGTESDPEPPHAADTVTLVIPLETPLKQAQKEAASAYWAEAWRGRESQAREGLEQELGRAAADALRDGSRPFNFAEPPPHGTDPATVALRVSFLVLPRPAAIVSKRQAWTRPSTAALLPERLMLIGHSGSERVEEVGAMIQHPLVVGPDPLADEADQLGRDGRDVRIPPAMAWMMDFERAIEVGMAFRIDLTPQQQARGFDRLLVLGLRALSDKEAARRELETHFDHLAASHSGFAILPQGTPTNNSETSTSGWSRVQEADNLFALSERARAGGTSFDPSSDADGVAFARALGIDPARLQHVANATRTDQAERRAMNTALWPATIGYTLDTQLRPIFDDQEIARTRRHFIDYVSGRGTVPAIRIGKQPYGILATSALSRFDATEERFLSRLQELVRKTEELFWSPATREVPRVGTPSANPQQRLLDLLGLHASSVEFHLNVVEGPERLWNMFARVPHLRPHLPHLHAIMRALIDGNMETLRDLGYHGSPVELAEKFFSFSHGAMRRPAVHDGELSELDPLPPCTVEGRNYIAWCRDSARNSFDALRRQAGFEGNVPPNALLFHLLRHAIQLAFHRQAVLLHIRASLLKSEQVNASYREPPFIHVDPDRALASESRYRLLYAREHNIAGSRELTVAGLLSRRPDAGDAELRELLDALDVLADLPTARLERAFAEHLDLASYRWDSWALSLVAQRLDSQRARQRAGGGHGGIYLGAYAWVENLRPDPLTHALKELDPAQRIEFGEGPVFRDANNGGHVLAPSLNHAVTAAVLRNGYLVNATPDQPDLLAINLSSARVRVALRFLEGMRNAQPLGALLGYRLERRLHDRHAESELDALIYELRRVFPLAANRNAETADDGVPSETIDARNVVDGWRLIEHVRASRVKTYPWGTDLRRSTPEAEAILDAEVQGLFEIHDAIADLMVAESVHQMCMGNADRAAAAMDTFSKGGFPPDPDFVRTPRSGLTLTHRVALHLSAEDVAAPGASPRAAAEPALDRGLARLLPPLDQVRVRVHYRNTPDAVVSFMDVDVASLGFSPIDLLMLTDLQSEAAASELDDRIANRVLAAAALCPDAALEIHYSEPVEGALTLFEVTPLITTLRDLVLQARPLQATDACLQAESSDRVDASAEVPDGPLRAAQASLRELLQSVTTLLAETPPLETEVAGCDAWLVRFHDAQLAASSFGSSLSGHGRLRSGRAEFFRVLRTSASELFARWTRKLAEADTYVAAAQADDRARMIALLAAERQLSTSATSPIPDSIAAMERIVSAKRDSFAAALAQVEQLAQTRAQTMTALWTAYLALLPTRAAHDDTPIDLTNESRPLIALMQDARQQLLALRAELQKRDAAAEALLTQADAAEGATRVQKRTDAGKELLGDGFRILPRFRLSSDQTSEWQNANDHREALLSHAQRFHEFPVDDWLYGVARVRPRMHDLEQVVQLTGAFALTEPALTPVQLPFRTGDPWLALELPPDLALSYLGQRLLYTAVHLEPFRPERAEHVGLLLDAWTEVIPAKQETAGLAFHYDRPSNEPPQALLLVSCPSRTPRWSWDDLELAVVETFQLARKRAVEPRHLAGHPLARLLPATWMAAAAQPVSIGSRLRAYDAAFPAEEE